MKNFTLLVFALIVVSLSAQETTIAPFSWHYADADLNALEVLDVETFDHDALLAEDVLIERETGRENYGRIAFEDVSPDNSGTWTHFDDGSKMWRLKFTSSDALAVSVFFDQYYIPEGAKLWVWSADRSFSDGPYDHTDNNDHGYMGTSEVFGDTAVLEYYQPADVVGELQLSTHGFGHYYTHIFDYRDEKRGGSQPCEVDVKCPEGDGYMGQINSTTRMRITDGQFLFLCSGVMMNNTELDCRQIMLTAYHCTEGVSNADLLLMQVRFNYERTGCGSGASISSHNRTGVLSLGHSNDGGGQSGSDYAVYEVEDDILEGWEIFYAGWDASGTGSVWGIGTHHPSGDTKKISSYDSPIVSDSWGFASGSHWRVSWIATETDHGVTEGGSSGSPLWNTWGQVVGTLTGGSSCCEGSENPQQGCVSNTSPDWYGKMSYHWDNNNNATTDLKEVLDPSNSGVEELFGAFAPNCDQSWLQVVELEFDDVTVFPNPTSDIVSFSIPKRFELSSIKIYNAMGQLMGVESTRFNSGELDLRGMSDGIYYLTFTTSTGQQVTKKVTVI